MKYTKKNRSEQKRCGSHYERIILRRTQVKRIRPCDSFTSRVTGADPYRPITSHLSILPILIAQANKTLMFHPKGAQAS